MKYLEWNPMLVLELSELVLNYSSEFMDWKWESCVFNPQRPLWEYLCGGCWCKTLHTTASNVIKCFESDQTTVDRDYYFLYEGTYISARYKQTENNSWEIIDDEPHSEITWVKTQSNTS